MAEMVVEYGIQECSKCQYKLRCEECVYYEKDIAELMRFEKEQVRKETAREVLEEAIKKVKEKFNLTNGYTTCYDVVFSLTKIAQDLGVKLEDNEV